MRPPKLQRGCEVRTVRQNEVVAKRSLIEPARERMPELRLLLDVAEKAIALGRAAEAERLLASAVNDFTDFATHASTPEQIEAVANMRMTLTPILRQLEAATGKRWMASLEAGRAPNIWTRLPRGQS